MRYIKEYNHKYYQEIGEVDFLNQDALLGEFNDDTGEFEQRIEVGEFKISTITESEKKRIDQLLHADNFGRQWIKYINISIHDISEWRFMIKRPDDVRNKSLHIIIKPEVDIKSREWIRVGMLEFYIESFLIEDEYYYVRIDSQNPPMMLVNGDLQTRYVAPSTKYFKCDQVEGLADCLKEEIPNWYPGLRK